MVIQMLGVLTQGAHYVAVLTMGGVTQMLSVRAAHVLEHAREQVVARIGSPVRALTNPSLLVWVVKDVNRCDTVN